MIREDLKSLYLLFTRMLDTNERRDVLFLILDYAHYSPIYVELGDLELGEEDNAKASQYFQKALELEPNNASAWRGLASCHLKGDNIRKASNAIKKAISLLPQDARNWEIKAKVNFANGHYHESYQATRMGLQLIENPIETDPFLIHGLKYHELIEIAQEQARSSRLQVQAALYLHQVDALFQMDDIKVDDILEALAIARVKFPKEQIFYIYPAIILYEDKPEEALALLDEAVKAGVEINKKIADELKSKALAVMKEKEESEIS